MLLLLVVVMVVGDSGVVEVMVVKVSPLSCVFFGEGVIVMGIAVVQEVVVVVIIYPLPGQCDRI